jgi:hypothetical protein
MRRVLAVALVTSLCFSTSAAYAQSASSSSPAPGSAQSVTDQTPPGGSGGLDALGQDVPPTPFGSTAFLIGGGLLIGGGALVAVAVSNSHSNNNPTPPASP